MLLKRHPLFRDKSPQGFYSLILQSMKKCMKLFYQINFLLLTSIGALAQSETFKLSSQTEKHKIKSIGISIPVVWNNSEATYYRLGSPMYPSGKAISYGININHCRTIYKNLFGIVGIGYFKQSFGIIRPFNYDSPNSFGYATDSYSYYNAHLYGGFGYKSTLGRSVALMGKITYNHLYSFRQKYINRSPVPSQINHNSMSIGRMINLNIGVDRNITKKVSIGLDVQLPISSHWNNDEIFVKYEYSNDAQQIGRNKFSIGTAISCNYNF